MSKELRGALGHFSSKAVLEPRDQEGKLVGPGCRMSLFHSTGGSSSPRGNVLLEKQLVEQKNLI